MTLRSTYKSACGLIFLCLVAFALNITKPIHIDDTAYLEMAQAILRDPWHPLSQSVNWSNTAEPIFNINQPPLLPYVLAGVLKVFGTSELALHFVMTLPSAAAILLFYWLAKLYEVNQAMLVTALLALGPAFLPGQNLMFDVTLLALWLVFFVALVAHRRGANQYWLLLAVSALALACLVKYTSLALVPLYVGIVLWRRRPLDLFWLLIPLLVLVAWAAFSYFDYGAIHILARETRVYNFQKNVNRVISWIAGLGSISPFVFSFWSLKNIKTSPGWAWVLGAIVLLSAAAVLLGSPLQLAGYWAVFVAVGLVCLIFTGLTCFEIWRSSQQPSTSVQLERTLILAGWIICAFLFIVFFSPFIAIRHILLVVPPVLLLLGQRLNRSGINVIRETVSLVLTGALGVGLAVSDYYYADVYRTAPGQIAALLPAQARAWQVGHWGWQWYARQAGLWQYDTLATQLQPGDYLIVPMKIAAQSIESIPKQTLSEVRTVTVAAPLATYLRTMASSDPVGGYYSFEYPLAPPWRFSRVPFTFYIYVVSATQ